MTHQPRPFTIRIFVPAGNPDGLRIVEKINWTGVGVVCPRALYPEAKKRKEFTRTGVYVLVGNDEFSGDLMLYIGEGESVKSRIDQHMDKKNFWDRLIFFTAKDGNLNKAHVKYLEARLINIAKDAKRAVLDNTQFPKKPTLSEADQADAESFLLDILSIFPLVGLTAFEKPRRPKNKKNLLRISSKGVVATGYESAGGFVVMSQSQAVTQEVESLPRYMSNQRSRLLKQKVLKKTADGYVFQQDYELNSPSMAAAVVLGRPTNGRTAWKDSQDRTLKRLQEGQAEEPPKPS